MKQTTIFLVRNGGQFKILRLGVSDTQAVDNEGQAWTLSDEMTNNPHWYLTGGNPHEWWMEVVGPTMAIELKEPEPETIEVFMVEEKSYIDQWGFERTESVKTITRRLTLTDEMDNRDYHNRAALQRVAIDDLGSRYIQGILESTLWICRTTGATWYSQYPGQLMEKTT